MAHQCRKEIANRQAGAHNIWPHNEFALIMYEMASSKINFNFYSARQCMLLMSCPRRSYISASSVVPFDGKTADTGRLMHIYTCVGFTVISLGCNSARRRWRNACECSRREGVADELADFSVNRCCVYAYHVCVACVAWRSGLGVPSLSYMTAWIYVRGEEMETTPRRLKRVVEYKQTIAMFCVAYTYSIWPLLLWNSDDLANILSPSIYFHDFISIAVCQESDHIRNFAVWHFEMMWYYSCNVSKFVGQIKLEKMKRVLCRDLWGSLSVWVPSIIQPRIVCAYDLCILIGDKMI